SAFFFQAEDGIRDFHVTGVQTCALPICKRESAKYKIDRRLGENIWGRPKSPVNRREYGPGQHGQRRKGKLSDFGVQLRAKQKIKIGRASCREKVKISAVTG